MRRKILKKKKNVFSTQEQQSKRSWRKVVENKVKALKNFECKLKRREEYYAFCRFILFCSLFGSFFLFSTWVLPFSVYFWLKKKKSCFLLVVVKEMMWNWFTFQSKRKKEPFLLIFSLNFSWTFALIIKKPKTNECFYCRA